MADVSLSIIILNYNTSALLIACISSIIAAKTINDRWEIIIVDNGSTDGSVDEIKKMKRSDIRVIQNKKNIGFAAGNNVGIRLAKAKYILLLNSDTEVTKDAIATEIAFMETHPDAGVVTAKLILADGSMDMACHRGFPTPWAAFTYMTGLEKLFPNIPLFSAYHLAYKGFTTIHQIDSPSGAFFLVRKEVIDQAGLLDEDYFMYGEDLDWAYRIKAAGWNIYFNPQAEVVHRKKQSGLLHQDPQLRRKTEEHFASAMQIFYKKHYAHRYGWLVTQLVLLGIKLHSFL